MAKNPRLKDFSGQKVGRWFVISQNGNHPRGGALWLCRCDCGTERTVLSSDLSSGKSNSCGCLQKEKVAQRMRTHGKSGTRLHRIWKGMKTRCTNPEYLGYKNYGGRGVSICPEWLVFEVFEAWALSNGYSKELSIERIDVNGGYSPENCTFADASVQSANRNYTRKRDDGVLWWHIARDNSITRSAYASRVHAGWPIELASTLPMNARRSSVHV